MTDAKKTPSTKRPAKPSSPAPAKAKPSSASRAKQATIQTDPAPPPAVRAVPAPAVERQLHGRAVFAVSTTGTAVAVETAFLTTDGDVVKMPSVFPTRAYALEQIDELRRLVNQHFDKLGLLN